MTVTSAIKIIASHYAPMDAKIPAKYRDTVIEDMLIGRKGDGKLDRKALTFYCMDAAIYQNDFDVPGKINGVRMAGNQLTKENITELIVAIDKHKVKYVIVMGHENSDSACGMSHVSKHEEHMAEEFAKRRGASVEKARPIISRYLSCKDIGDAKENVISQLKWLSNLEENGIPIVPGDVELVGMYYTKDRKVELLAWTEGGRLVRYGAGGKVEQFM